MSQLIDTPAPAVARSRRKRKASTQMKALEPLEPLASQEKAPPFPNLLDMEHTLAETELPKLMKKQPKKK